MAGPLAGVRVVDMTHVLNGPFCTMLLGHLGAEIIKIETGPGDRFRRSWMPPDADHDAYEFVVVNCNKKGITLNLKTDEGKDVLRRLVRSADVLVENFTIGVMDRLGLGWDSLREVNPRLIYACTRGYGETGPYAHVRANAATNMAMTGWTKAALDLSGSPLSGDSGIGDEAAGVSLALGITSALFEREKSGRGQKIEVSMQEALLGFMVQTLHEHFEGITVAAAAKQCKDGWYAFFIQGFPDAQMAKLCEAMGRPELAQDPRFESVKARAWHKAELEAVLDEFVATRTRQELWDIFGRVGISSGPVLAMDEVMDDEHVKARKVFAQFDRAGNGPMSVPAPWIRFSETECVLERPAPAVGQDNEEVYKGILGLSEEEYRRLHESGTFS
jgi:crotonobetainyl-CoA:carnitine CoA-transferase CaiB-like acyl-CoA transferase